MDTFRDLHNILINQLLKFYQEREANNIAKIYFEDKFNICNLDKSFNNQQYELFQDDIFKFETNIPVQYIVGKSFFYNNFFIVDKSVLIPRPETEILVQEAINICENNKDQSIIDIGTGSGCIALSISEKCHNCNTLGIDISTKALKIANKNLNKLNLSNVKFEKIDFLNRDQWKELGKFDLIVSNPPYIKEVEKKLMSASTLKHEPYIALFPKDSDYLIFYKTIFEFSKYHLKPNGCILCELNEFSIKDISDILTSYNFTWKIIDDLQGKPRVLKLTC